MSDLIDFAGINSAALARGRNFLAALIPGGKFRGLEYIVRNPRRDDRQAGSFSINYRSGVWKDFATRDGGSDLISLQAYVKGGRARRRCPRDGGRARFVVAEVKWRKWPREA